MLHTPSKCICMCFCIDIEWLQRFEDAQRFKAELRSFKEAWEAEAENSTHNVYGKDSDPRLEVCGNDDNSKAFELQTGGVVEVEETKSLYRCRKINKWLEVNFSRLYQQYFYWFHNCLPKQVRRKNCLQKMNSIRCFWTVGKMVRTGMNLRHFQVWEQWRLW